ncbi:uncharacterized protein LOC126826797 isoform X2 [Patella vulgata]|uniref:uncharacterized protein LOC126826797 isoform X2 n=1 Tax=Patella vulgata TaxID=6465 RepID=UPI00217FBB80|nr:uncharacterized protein LOC126826797 isoform X2 [Patella vulgata]
MSSRSTTIRVETVDDVSRIPDLLQAMKVMRELHITTTGVRDLDQAKAKIIENFSKEKAHEIYSKNDRDPMQLALKENEANREKLTQLFRKCDAYLRSMSSQFQDDLRRTFPEFETVFQQRERDLQISSCYILVAGETGAGKSSVINLLLGSNVLPTSDLQCTANICELRKSDRRYYVLVHRIKENERRKQRQIVDYDERGGVQHFLENLAGHIQLVDQTTEESKYEKIEIYWPFPFNMDNIVFVDTPGIGDNLNLSKSLQTYMGKTFGFIYVINSAAAGGVHRDRLGRLLRAAQERGDEDFDPSAALFVCNKQDLIKQSDVAEVMEATIAKLKMCYPGVESDQLYPISSREAIKTAEYNRGMLKEHTALVTGVRDVLPKIFHSQLAAHYRWLASVIKRTLYTLKVSRVIDAKSINDKENELSDIKAQMAALARRAEDRITIMKTDMKNSIQSVANEVLRVLDQCSPELSMWGPSTCPQPEKDWKSVTRNASNVISSRISQLIDDWCARRDIVGQIKRSVLDKFKNEFELFEDQIKEIEGTFLGAETRAMSEYHQSMKSRSNVKAVWKTQKKERDYGVSSLGIAVGEATSLNIKDAQVKKLFKDYSTSSKPGEIMRQATLHFLHELNKSTLTESLKKYFTRFFKEIDEISGLIPKFLESDRELIKTLTLEVQESESKIFELYPELITNCSDLRSRLDMFYCRKLMKTDFSFRSFNIEKTELGEGTFAKVYKAKMPGEDFYVALKVSKDPLKESTVSDVLLEHEFSRDLKHRNIIRYYGSSRIVKDQQIKFVMVLEYCTMTLQQLINREAEKLPAKAGSVPAQMMTAMLNMADLAYQICAGLGYLHQKSVVHRDLKTENILLTEDRVVKLSDLGLAKVGLGVTNQVGSPVYMAPEILLVDTKTPYDTKADVYSLGIILWELWYGQDVADHIQVMIMGSFEESIKRGLRPSLTLKTKPPSEWANMITKCWDKHAPARPKCNFIMDFFADFIKAHKK